MKPDHENVSYDMVFGYDIEHEILEIEEPKEYVDDAIIDIDSSINHIAFGEEQSLIVNISAKSLKQIYELYYMTIPFPHQAPMYHNPNTLKPLNSAVSASNCPKYFPTNEK